MRKYIHLCVYIFICIFICVQNGSFGRKRTADCRKQRIGLRFAACHVSCPLTCCGRPHVNSVRGFRGMPRDARPRLHTIAASRAPNRCERGKLSRQAAASYRGKPRGAHTSLSLTCSCPTARRHPCSTSARRPSRRPRSCRASEQRPCRWRSARCRSSSA